jgi:hypothetical protein
MSGLTNVDNILIQQSPYEAIQFVSGSSITNVKINNATIQNTGTWVVQEQVAGSATISNSTATGTQAPAPIYKCGVGFTLTDGGGNSGVTSPTACQNITNPAFPPYLPDSGGATTVISLRAHANGMYVTSDNTGAQPLIANRTAIGAWEQFDLLDASGGNVALRAHANNMIVTAENAGAQPLIANRTTIGLWETFQLVHNTDGSVSLRALADNKYVTAENAGAQPLIANRTAIAGWEEFDLITQ